MEDSSRAPGSPSTAQSDSQYLGAQPMAVHRGECKSRPHFGVYFQVFDLFSLIDDGRLLAYLSERFCHRLAPEIDYCLINVTD